MARQQDDLLALLNDSGEATVDQAMARARGEVDGLDNVVLNIAITGVTGAGKPTLVNTLRGVRDTDAGVAAVGETETTLVLSLPVYSLQSLEKKYNTFKKAVWALAVLSGGIGGVPVAGLSTACDVVIVLSVFTKCYFSFGLDDKSLAKLEKRANKPILEMVRTSTFVRADKTFLSIKMAARLGAAGVIEAVCSLVPVAGNIAAAGVSFVTTRSVLNEGLEELYKAAQKVIELSELQ